MSQSAHRTLGLLEYLALSGPSSLSSIATDLKLNKSTAHRFVSALVERGYVQQNPTTRRYSPTPKLVELAYQVLDRIEIRKEVRPFLEELASRSSETAHLAILDGLEIVYMDKVEGSQAVRMASRIGARGLCHTTALGKVLLAALPKEEWANYVKEVGLRPRTARTIIDRDRFLSELERVREVGYAIDDVENEEGIRCVGAPIRDHTGSVAAAMSLSGWTVSMTPERVVELAPLVVDLAAQASDALGHSERDAIELV